MDGLVAFSLPIAGFGDCFLDFSSFFFRWRSMDAVSNAPSRKPMVVVEIKRSERGGECFQKIS